MEPDSRVVPAILGVLKFSCKSSDPTHEQHYAGGIVDPHIRPEQPGLSTDLNKSDDAVNYLRRLKGTVAEGLPSGAAPRGDGKAGSCDDGSRVQRSAAKPQAPLFGQRGVSSPGQRRAHVGNSHRHQPARVLRGNERHVSHRYESGSGNEVVRHPDSYRWAGCAPPTHRSAWASALRRSNPANRCN